MIPARPLARPLVLILSLLATAPALADCPVDGYRADTGGGSLVYAEDAASRATPESAGRLTFFRGETAVWSIATLRSCGIGFPLCTLSLLYRDSSGAEAALVLPLDNGSVDLPGAGRQCYLAVAQMGERLALLLRDATDPSGHVGVTLVSGEAGVPPPGPADLADRWLPSLLLASQDGG